MSKRDIEAPPVFQNKELLHDAFMWGATTALNAVLQRTKECNSIHDFLNHMSELMNQVQPYGTKHNQ